MTNFNHFKSTRTRVDCLSKVYPENGIAAPGYVWLLEGWKLVAEDVGNGLVRWHTDDDGSYVDDTIDEMEKLLYLEYR